MSAILQAFLRQELGHYEYIIEGGKLATHRANLIYYRDCFGECYNILKNRFGRTGWVRTGEFELYHRMAVDFENALGSETIPVSKFSESVVLKPRYERVWKIPFGSLFSYLGVTFLKTTKLYAVGSDGIQQKFHREAIGEVL